jgi:CHRD domain-containing protein
MIMNTRYSLVMVAAITTAGLVVNILITGFSFSVFAQQQEKQRFTAILTGSEVVPKTSTKAIGVGEFLPSTNKTMVAYTVNVTNIDNVTMVDIHEGKTGEEGPVAVTLFKSAADSAFHVPGGSYLLAQGNITSSDLQGSVYGKQYQI